MVGQLRPPADCGNGNAARGRCGWAIEGYPPGIEMLSLVLVQYSNRPHTEINAMQAILASVCRENDELFNTKLGI